MRALQSLLGALFRCDLRASDLPALWRRLSDRNEFVPNDFEPTRLVLRTEEMTDGRAVHVGEGLEVSEQHLHTLPAELQAEFATQIRRAARSRVVN
jgi:hypothetical protein